MPRKDDSANGRKFTTYQGLDAYVKAICDILRRSNCTAALLRRAFSGEL